MALRSYTTIIEKEDRAIVTSILNETSLVRERRLHQPRPTTRKPLNAFSNVPTLPRSNANLIHRSLLPASKRHMGKFRILLDLNSER
jgi:Tfp pilus assembly protein PilE